MHSSRTISERRGERGVVILLVAIVLLFVVGAMAVLAIDLVTFYTARSEAQLAANGAALAGARVLANSGATSNPADTTLETNAQSLANQVATQVALQNTVGGGPATSVTVTFPVNGSAPRVTVVVSRNDLPTFFARIWGTTQIAISASATAEAYNPSAGNTLFGAGSAPPIAPSCVKPWLLPNLDSGSGPIFDATNGTIVSTTAFGSSITTLQSACSDCSTLPATLNPWSFLPASQTSFPAPTQSLFACSSGYNPYQLSVAGCVQTPVACGDGSVLTSNVLIDRSPYLTDRTTDTVAATNCLTHSTNGNGDRIDTTAVVPPPPFQFIAGADNPVTDVVGSDMMVSDSLVTVPVFDSSAWSTTATGVQVIGFAQLFLNPDGLAPAPAGPIHATIVNLAGCGTSATGRPILGNGASAIPVRLVTPP